METMSRISLPDRLAREIRDAIERGTYAEGDRLPSIPALARTFGVAQITVRVALSRLESLGVVEVRQGSGVYALNTRLAALLDALRAPG
jgi:GntR family transcriptional repressor for pyruvate dehydrogenase complex